MREWDYQELRSKQAELAALGQILDEHADMTERDRGATGEFEFMSWDFIRQQSGLKRLEENGLIRIVEESTLHGIHLAIITQPSLLKDMYEKLHE